MNKAVCCAVDGCESSVYCKGFCQFHYNRWKKWGDPLFCTRNTKEARAYIENLCNLKQTDTCVTWPFTTDQDGYARVGSKRVCRIICENVHGKPNDPTHHAAHSCGKGMDGCVAWWHLSWKTLTENNKDKLIHGTSGKRESNPNARLTEEQVTEIRQSTLGSIVLAKQFNVHRSTIYLIRKNRSW